MDVLDRIMFFVFVFLFVFDIRKNVTWFELIKTIISWLGIIGLNLFVRLIMSQTI